MNKSITLFIILLVVLGYNGLLCAQSSSHKIGYKIRKSDYLASFIPLAQKTVLNYLNENKVPGVSIALVDEKGILWSDVFGVRDTISKLPVNKQTMFGIASVTKPITAIVILKAAQNDIVNLDIPVLNYIPDIELFSKFENNPESKITIRHLLCHRAGLSHEAPLGNNWDGINCSLEEHIRSINGTWLKYPVGQRNAYSGTEFDLAAYILQKVMNKPYSECVNDILLSPLNMKRTSIEAKQIINDLNRAQGYTSRYKNKPPIFLPLQGGGMIYSTAEDLAKFLQMLLNYGSFNNVQYIDSLKLEDMFRIQWAEEGQVNGSGLGINRQYNFNNNYTKTYRLIHTGGGFGFGAVMEWFPKYGIGIVILTNSWDTNATVLADNILNKIFEDFNVVFEPNTTISGIIENAEVINPNLKYVGDYYSFTIYTEKEKCYIKMGGREPAIFSFMSPDAGFYKNNSGTNILRFFEGVEKQPDNAMSMSTGYVYSKNEGVKTPGPDKPEWQDYVGKYVRKRWGESIDTIRISIKEGNLYSNEIPLIEAGKGVFYQVGNYENSEIFDFREGKASYRNIRIEKIKNEINKKIYFDEKRRVGKGELHP